MACRRLGAKWLSYPMRTQFSDTYRRLSNALGMLQSGTKSSICALPGKYDINKTLGPIFTKSYLNQCWIIVNWALRNKLQWNFNQNRKVFIHKNASENIVCETVAILSRERWVKPLLKIKRPWVIVHRPPKVWHHLEHRRQGRVMRPTLEYLLSMIITNCDYSVIISS